MRDLDECRPYVMHLHAEHQRIHAMLRDIQTLFATPSDKPLRPQLNERLVALRKDLAHHFKQEEEGGCIEEAISRCPSLSHEATEVEAEHDGLLENLDQLIGLGSRLQSPERIGDFESKFKQFTKTLHAHEVAENRILQRAFGSSFDCECED